MTESTVNKYFVRSTINVNAVVSADKRESALAGVFEQLAPEIERLNEQFKGVMIFKVEPFTTTATEMPE